MVCCGTAIAVQVNVALVPDNCLSGLNGEIITGASKINTHASSHFLSILYSLTLYG